MAVNIQGDNSAASPAFTGGDTDTGVRMGTNELSLVTGGTNRVNVDSSGNVGVGEASPSTTLHVTGANTSSRGQFCVEGSSSADARISLYRDGTDFIGAIQTSSDSVNIAVETGHAIRFVTNNSNRLQVLDGGNIQFGANVVNRASENCTTFGGMTTFSDLDKNGAAINNNGRFIGTQSSQGLTSIVLYQRGTATTQYMMEFFRKQVQSGGDNSYDFVGSITTNFSNTSFNTGSDYRLKENIINLTGAIDRVKQLQPRRFNFIKDPGNTVDGFVAHEAQTVVPESITGTKDEVADFGNVLDQDNVVIESDVRQPEELPEGETWVKTGTKPVYQAIDQSKLVPLLTAALQEAIIKIETLETKVAALEGGN